MNIIRGLILMIGLLGLVTGSQAQSYPAKPIRLIVPFSPGATTDILARVIGDRLTEKFSQQVIVDNRPGAGGNIAAEIVAQSKPDGYTIFLGSMGTQTMNVSLYPKLKFDPIRNFAPITLVAVSANLLLVRPSAKFESVKELIQFARANPGKLNYASAGPGSFNHISAALFSKMAGVKMVHIPYKGGGAALGGVLANEADLIFLTMPAAVLLVKAGRLNALAIGTKERHAQFPQIPTVAESGVPGFDVRSWYGILAPAGTPKAVLSKLHAAITSAIAEPATNRRLSELGVDPTTNSPAQFAELIRSDTRKWARVINEIGAKVD